MLAPLLLSALLAHCAPAAGPLTMAAIVRVESGGDPLAIHDNTADRSYAPADTQTAVALATQLIAQGHSVDLGLMQINTANLAPLGLTAGDAFAPCTNIAAGARILSAAYAHAQRRFGGGQFALRRALGAYNTGSLSRGDRYIAAVVAAAVAHRALPAMPAPPVMLLPRALRARVASLRNVQRAVAHRSAAHGSASAAELITPEDAPILVPATVATNDSAI